MLKVSDFEGLNSTQYEFPFQYGYDLFYEKYKDKKGSPSSILKTEVTTISLMLLTTRIKMS